MFEGSLSLGSREWLWPAAVLFGFGVILVAWSYFKSRGAAKVSIFAAILKLVGFALLAACLLEPMKIATRPREGVNLFAVVADNSQGLQIKDKGQTLSRGELLRNNLLAAQQGWQEVLARTFQIRRYIFDNRLQSSENFGDLKFDGTASSLGVSLRMLQERFHGQPLAGVFLFTDGNATDANPLSSVDGLPPVYPVVLGESEGLQDLAIENVSVSQTAFEDAPVTIVVEATGYEIKGESVLAEILSDTGGTNVPKVVSRQRLPAKSDESKLSFRFQIKPEKPGLSFYTARVSLEKRPEGAVEATLANNERVVTVDRGKGPYRILYVGGRPNWEFKFLNRAISEDPQLQLPAILRVARREQKFEFRGRAGESSNPIFRGFDKTSEETERYDQPVLVRLNMKDEHELRSGFPKSPEDLYNYHAIILDDLESSFFTQDQMLLIQKFVSERGGGFLMLGGVDSLEDGKYVRTPIGEMLPVYLDRGGTVPPPALLKLELSREGWLEPWVRLRSTEQEERTRLEEIPRYQVINTLREIKPGASVLARAKDERGTDYPALVVQRFGNGRTGSILLGDLWRAGLPDEKKQEDLGKMWRQVARWLTGDVPEQLELAIVPASTEGVESMKLVVKTRDKKFEPMDNAVVTLHVRPPRNAAPIKLEAESSSTEAGIYQSEFVPRVPGAYRVRASVEALDGTRIGDVESGWAADPLAQEFKSLKPNMSLLEELARKTGGKVLRMTELEEFAGTLTTRPAPVMETYSYPLWHRSWVFAAALLCFVAEWGMRRWKGLA